MRRTLSSAEELRPEDMFGVPTKKLHNPRELLKQNMKALISTADVETAASSHK